MRHRTASAEPELEDQSIEYKLEPAPCYYCSTTEGEPELHFKTGSQQIHPQPGILYFYSCKYVSSINQEDVINK